MTDPNRRRPSWDDYFMGITQQVAKRSTCDRARVGAIIVKDRRILTTGYNGSPAGLPHCDEIGHLMVDGHCVRTLHAEQNAIIQAALHGVINAGIVRVVYGGQYPDDNSVAFLAQAGVALQRYEGRLPDE